MRGSHRFLIPSALWTPLLLTLGGWACAPADPAMGIGAEDVPLELSPGLEFALGGMEGQDWQAFGEVVRLAFHPDGTLLILDPAAARVRMVGRDGALLRSFGERGGGPGEMGFPLGITATVDGAVVVFDSGNRAFLRFDDQGRYLENVPVDVTSGMPGQVILPHPHGGVASLPVGVVFRMAGQGAPSDPSLPVYHWALDGTGQPPTVLARAWRPDREDLTSPIQLSGGSGIAMRAPPLVGFEPPASLAILPDGTLAVLDSSAYRIRRVRPDGSEAPPIARPIEPRPVTPEDQEADRARRLERLEAGQGPRVQITTQGPGGAGATTLDQEAVRSMLRQQLEAMVFWTEVPVLQRIAADPQGRLWVERRGLEGGLPGPTDLFAVDGEYLGTLPGGTVWIPDAFSADGRGAYVVRDELDVVTVEVRRLPLPGAH